MVNYLICGEMQGHIGGLCSTKFFIDICVGFRGSTNGSKLCLWWVKNSSLQKMFNLSFLKELGFVASWKNRGQVVEVESQSKMEKIRKNTDVANVS